MYFNKSMGLYLIVAGIAAIVAGIMILTHGNNESDYNDVEQAVVPVAPERVVQFSKVDDCNGAHTAAMSSKEKGDAFEDFVVNLLADYRLTLLDRTQDAVSSAGVVAESCKNPDLHVQQMRGKSNIDYYLECKYRSRWTEDVITFENWQIERYRQFQRDNHRKVIIALGVGGSADSPATFRLVPLDSIRDNTIRRIDTKFTVAPTSSALIEYMDGYFSSVFSKSKSKRNDGLHSSQR